MEGLKMCKNVGKTRKQWSKLILYILITVGAGIGGSKYPLLGQYTGVLITVGFASPFGMYFWRIARYFTDVRMYKPKYILTGDGGDNYYSVITKKYWNPFWIAPLDHFKLPIMAQETIAIPKTGSISSGKRPLAAIAHNEKISHPIPHNATMGEGAKRRITALKTFIPVGQLNNVVDKDWEFVQVYIPNMSENEFYELKGLLLMQRAGVKFGK